MERLAAAEAACTSDHGRWNADHTCTSAADLVAEAAEMNCEAGGGRYESDGSCTSATELAAEQLEADRMACTSAGGRWNDDDSCTSAADLVKEGVAAAAMSKKLYDGISIPTTGDIAGGNFTANDRVGAYDTAETAILVSIGPGGTDTPTAVSATLSEDKKTMVSDNHGWTGKKYADPAGGDMYEAVVYSNVGDPTPGGKFSATYTLTAADTSNPGEVALTTGVSGTAAQIELDTQARIASLSFDQSAGTKAFELPTNTLRVMRSGSYHGVAGTYYCTPAENNMCASQVAAKGFALGGVSDADSNPATPPVFTAAGGTWTFKPNNPDALVMSVADTDYASYGWWIRKSENDMYTASAFVDDKGTVAAATGITALRGRATYMGGAAGKYALHSATGGTNDSGHFTARAVLEADFGDDMITGTIDQFKVGDDGESRDNWSVGLMKQTITDGGVINGTDGAGADVSMTKWTIDDTAAAESGQWTGALKDNGDDGVPKVGTGTFYSTYGTAGKMVGAFGVNKQ